MDQDRNEKVREKFFKIAQEISFEQAKEMLRDAITLNEVNSAEAVLSREDFKTMPQPEKDRFLLTCDGSSPQIALVLVAAGANPNIHRPAMLSDLTCRCYIAGKEKYCNRKTPLHGSAEAGSVLNVQLLVNMATTQIDARDHKQNTPLMLACKIYGIRIGKPQIKFNHYLMVIGLLLKHGANKELVNKRGKTAAQIALDLKRDADRDPELIGFSDQIIARLEQVQSALPY